MRKFDKRMAFIIAATKRGLSSTVAANDWYIATKGHKTPNAELLVKYIEWLPDYQDGNSHLTQQASELRAAIAKATGSAS